MRSLGVGLQVDGIRLLWTDFASAASEASNFKSVNLATAIEDCTRLITSEASSRVDDLTLELGTNLRRLRTDKGEVGDSSILHARAG